MAEHWLDLERLSHFLDDLRAVGYAIGVDEHLAVQRLVFSLIEQDKLPEDPEQFVTLLGPLICNTPSEQREFQQRYQEWLVRAQVEPPARVTDHPLELELREIERKDRLRWVWAGLLILLVPMLIGVYFRATIRELVEELWFARPVAVASPRPPQADSGTTSDGPSSTTVPAPNLTPVVTRAPQPVPIAQSEVMLEQSLDARILAALLSVPPRTRRLVVLSLVTLTVLLGMVAVRRVWYRYRAELMLQRRESDEPPDITELRIERVTSDFFDQTALRQIARLFRDRIEQPSAQLDIQRTLAKTLANGGWFTPVHATRPEMPEYVMLLDKVSSRDQQARFVEQLAAQLRQQDVPVVQYTFYDSPTFCYRLDGHPLSLGELSALHATARLLIFGSVDSFFDSLTGEPAEWTSSLSGWQHVGYFTPDPPLEWGAREAYVANEVGVWPATTQGLLMFIRTVLGHQESGLATDRIRAGRIPEDLDVRPMRWIQDRQPTEADAVLAAVQCYLGPDGFAWFRACAIYPEVSWDLTLFLGHAVQKLGTRSERFQRVLLDMVRLPWFRFGRMPDWLRIRLIAGLSWSEEAEIRDAIQSLLLTAVQDRQDSTVLEIAEQKSEAKRQLTRGLMEVLSARPGPDSPFRDHVFLTFMDSRVRTRLAFRLPEPMAATFRTDPTRTFKARFVRNWIRASVGGAFGSMLLGAAIGFVVGLVYPLVFGGSTPFGLVAALGGFGLVAFWLGVGAAQRRVLPPNGAGRAWRHFGIITVAGVVASILLSLSVLLPQPAIYAAVGAVAGAVMGGATIWAVRGAVSVAPLRGTVVVSLSCALAALCATFIPPASLRFLYGFLLWFMAYATATGVLVGRGVPAPGQYAQSEPEARVRRVPATRILRWAFAIVLFFVAAVALLIVVGPSVESVYNSINSSLNPEQMTGSLNIAVAEFGSLDASGNVQASDLGSALSASLVESIPEWATEMLIGEMMQVTGADSIGLVRGQTSEERQSSAAAIADRINADVVLYGSLSDSEFQPEYYINSRNFAADPLYSQILGNRLLGQPLAISLLGVDAPSTVAASQVEAMSVLNSLYLDGIMPSLASMAYMNAGRPEQAVALLQSVERTMEGTDPAEAQEAVYLMLSASAIADDDYEEAQRAALRASAINPESPLALLLQGITDRNRARAFYESSSLPLIGVPVCDAGTGNFTDVQAATWAVSAGDLHQRAAAQETADAALVTLLELNLGQSLAVEAVAKLLTTGDPTFDAAMQYLNNAVAYYESTGNREHMPFAQMALGDFYRYQAFGLLLEAAQSMEQQSAVPTQASTNSQLDSAVRDEAIALLTQSAEAYSQCTTQATVGNSWMEQRIADCRCVPARDALLDAAAAVDSAYVQLQGLPASPAPATLLQPNGAEPTVVLDATVAPTATTSAISTTAPADFALQYGETVNWELTSRFGDEWTFSGNAGDAITLGMESDGFRPYLELYGPGSRDPVAESQSTQTGNSAVIEGWVLADTGEYVVVAAGQTLSDRGTYSLTLTLIDQTGATQAAGSQLATIQQPRTTPQTRTGIACAVSVAALNLRSGPGTDYVPPLASLAVGDELAVLARTTDTTWIQVQVVKDGSFGWVSASDQFLSCDGDLTTVPVGNIPPTPTPTSTPSPTSISTPSIRLLPTSSIRLLPTPAPTPTPIIVILPVPG